MEGEGKALNGSKTHSTILQGTMIQHLLVSNHGSLASKSLAKSIWSFKVRKLVRRRRKRLEGTRAKTTLMQTLAAKKVVGAIQGFPSPSMQGVSHLSKSCSGN